MQVWGRWGALGGLNGPRVLWGLEDGANTAVPLPYAALGGSGHCNERLLGLFPSLSPRAPGAEPHSASLYTQNTIPKLSQSPLCKALYHYIDVIIRN